MLFHVGLCVERGVAYQTPQHLKTAQRDEKRFNTIETQIDMRRNTG